MSLNQKQFRFTQMVARLIDFAYANGYALSFGEAYRAFRRQVPRWFGSARAE